MLVGDGLLSESEDAALLRIQRRGFISDFAMGQVRDELIKESREVRDIYLSGQDIIYFIMEFCKIYDPLKRGWIPFHLWPSQFGLVERFLDGKFLVVLKARQLGITWLGLAVALYESLFRPNSASLIYSLRDEMAAELLSNQRLRGMLKNLPEHLKIQKVIRENIHHIYFDNGSVIHGLTTTHGDGYTLTYSMVDEADLIPDLEFLIGRVQPAVEAGGRLVLISRSDKANPMSIFKQIYRGAKGKENGWENHFLPWSAHPDRNDRWYAGKKAEILNMTGSLDLLYANYPATDEEALAPSQSEKRIPGGYLYRCLDQMDAKQDIELPSERLFSPDLKVYHLPVEGERYFIGVDSAEGLPASNNSAIYIINENGCEVANLVGKHPPEMQAIYITRLSEWYNHALVMIENNFHGFTVLTWLESNGYGHLLMHGHNKKVGWSNNMLGKHTLYNNLAQLVQDRDVIIHDYACYLEIQSITISDLRAPSGLLDDRSDAFALAQMGRVYGKIGTNTNVYTLEW